MICNTFGPPKQWKYILRMIIKLAYYLRQGNNVLSRICLFFVGLFVLYFIVSLFYCWFVCLLFSNIIQKLMERF